MDKHRAGFVNIIGLPNVGKSTLMNALVGEKLSIITPKAQTTRQRVLGILNDEHYQLVFSDTPGYINQPAYKLQSTMNDSIAEALEDADVLVFVTDKYQKEEEQAHLIEALNKSKVPVITVINKMDLCTPEEVKNIAAKWQNKLPKSEVHIVSALHGAAGKELVKRIVELLPESPAYFEKDQISDRQVRFFVAEMVREKIFLYYDKEIPYSCQVVVEEYKESEKIDRIKCAIFTERESQKAILIGHGGEALKKVGIEARKDIEQFVGKQVHLEMVVKVKANWRDDENTLKKLGFE